MMKKRVRVTEYLDIDLVDEVWVCNRCGAVLGPAKESYKLGCLVHERDPREIYSPIVEGGLTLAPDPSWCRILEYYCPSCCIMVECEVLPPGHPITHDIELDLDALKERMKGAE
ncbi:MAG: acetone carboxylase subunit gamma [Candidatus Caldarchaeum sp.]